MFVPVASSSIKFAQTMGSIYFSRVTPSKTLKNFYANCWTKSFPNWNGTTRTPSRRIKPQKEYSRSVWAVAQWVAFLHIAPFTFRRLLRLYSKVVSRAKFDASSAEMSPPPSNPFGICRSSFLNGITKSTQSKFCYMQRWSKLTITSSHNEQTLLRLWPYGLIIKSVSIPSTWLESYLYCRM